MAESQVARAYAQALLELSREDRSTDRVAQDLKRFVALLANGELRRTLCTPLFDAAERGRVLDALVGRLQMQQLTNNFIRTLNEKDRLPEIEGVAAAFEELADEAAGRVRVQVSTAEPMTPQVEAELRSALERSLGKQIVLTSRVEPALIGGMVAAIGSKVYDSSIRTRLEQLRYSLLQSALPDAAARPAAPGPAEA